MTPLRVRTLLVVALCAACAQHSDLPGEYRLVAVDGKPLPTTGWDDACQVVGGGGLTLQANAKWQAFLVTRDSCGGAFDTSRFMGRWAAKDSAVTLPVDSFFQVGAFGSGASTGDSLFGEAKGGGLTLRHGLLQRTVLLLRRQDAR